MSHPPKQEKRLCRVSSSRWYVFSRRFQAGGDLVPLPHSADPPNAGQGFGHMRSGQSGANTTPTAASKPDIITIDVDIAIMVDIGGIIRVVAGRPQPPPRSRL